MKKTAVFIAAFFCAAALFAQVSIDPTDYFYTEVQSWQLKGLVKNVPLLRPYPANTIKAILEEVISSATDKETSEAIPRYERDLEAALLEYERIFSRPWHVSFEAGGTYKKKQSRTTSADGSLETENGSTKNYFAEPEVYGDVVFNSLVSAGYDFGLYAQSADWDDFLAKYQNPDHDSIQDAAGVGPADMYVDFNSAVSVGTATTYATAGLQRVGYGPFLNSGLSLNDTAYHAAGFSFNVVRSRWSYTSLFESLGATTNTGEDLAGNKYLAFHAGKFRVNDKLSVSYYESSVFGRRTDLSYLIPAPYMAIQGIGGCNDNIQMGLLVEYNPIHNLTWATDIFVDDLDVESIVKLKIKSKQRVAAQTGLIFAPEKSKCTAVQLDYTIVMPYTYSHWDYDDDSAHIISEDTWNYQNYTNAGIHIGTTLEPDSDRVSFTAKFKPAKRLTFTFGTAFVRHQNVAECLSDEEAAEYMLAGKNVYKTDGSIYMHANMSEDDTETSNNHVYSAWKNLQFMSGNHTEVTCQASFNTEWALPPSRKGHQLTLKAGYMFEYIRNAGVSSDIYSGGLSYTSNDDGTYTYGGTTYNSWTELISSDAVQDAVSAAYDSWVSNLCDKVNHYFTLAVKYSY
ncbi:MAG: hypothetical protein K6G80_06935 [Treponema sp.]|nr:hypothetical protein [Treponema sp.]